MTVTSNIHVGLAGWSNATYAAGQRRSNAGNAYQCTSPGTSTAPPTGTGTGITPGGTSVWKYLSAVDYTTLQAWANAIPTTLTQPIIGLLWNDSVITATAGTSILSLAGHTTSGSNTITLTPATGEGFLATFVTAPTTPYIYNNVNGISIEYPATGFGGINYIQIDDSNVIFRGLQIKDLNSASGATVIGGLGMIWIDKCIIDGQSQSGGARMIQMGASSVKITNSLIIDRSIGSPTSATVEAAGTGCVIVCSTFVKTAPSAPSAALDANNNSTTASNIIRDSIFVGYNTPFIAASGLPWVTDHNAFTNATFTSSGNATDTGGSIFSATASTLFVNSTADYHQNSSSPCLNAGVTDATDITTSDDTFGTSRPQGASWDIGPHELLAGSVILRDFTNPVEFGRVMLTRSFPTSIEWKYTNVVDIVVSQDNKSQPIASHNLYIDWNILASLDAIVPIERIAALAQPIRDAAVSLEWNVSIAYAPSVSIDWQSHPSVSGIVPIDFENNTRYDRVFPLSSSLSVFSDTIIRDEYSLSIQSDFNGQIASNTLISTDYVIPIEWKGISTILLDSVSPIEWRSNFSFSGLFSAEYHTEFDCSQPSNIEWINQALGLSVGFAVESRSAIFDDAISSVNWQTPFAKNATAYIDFGIAVTTDRAFPIDLTSEVGLSINAFCDPHSLVSVDFIQSLDKGLTVNQNSTVPLEIGGGSGGGATADALFPLEIRGGFFVENQFVTKIKASPTVDFAFLISPGIVSLVDYRAGSAWLSVPLSLAVLPSEWGHLLLTRSLDMTVPIEILKTVNADVSAAVNPRIGQDTIGSYLEPDSWEEANEPC